MSDLQPEVREKFLAAAARGTARRLSPVHQWWRSLSLTEAREVFIDHATAAECKRIQSHRAARTWWKSLSEDRCAEVHRLADERARRRGYVGLHPCEDA